MLSDDLKPCPICGCTSYFYGTAGRRNLFCSTDSMTSGFVVHCSKNCVSTRDYPTQEEASKVWNERVL